MGNEDLNASTAAAGRGGDTSRSPQPLASGTQALEEASDSEQSEETRSDVGWDNVYEKKRLMRDELSLQNDYMRGRYYWITYGGGPEGGFATDGEHGEGRVWSVHRDWHTDWCFERLVGQALEIRTTDEGFVRCRLRDATPDDEQDNLDDEDDNEEGDEEGDEPSSESEPDEDPPDSMDAATVAGSGADDETGGESDWSELKDTTTSAPPWVLWFSVFGFGLWSKLGSLLFALVVSPRVKPMRTQPRRTEGDPNLDHNPKPKTESHNTR
jgi:hypothetical protein